tara:strand:+ start:102 stop:320 length:219 start_codon:yes stop_codon:yes gene_type:complete
MELETKIMPSVSKVITYIKEKINIDIKEAKLKGIVDIKNTEIEKLCNLIESSVNTAFYQSSSEITNTIKKIK